MKLAVTILGISLMIATRSTLASPYTQDTAISTDQNSEMYFTFGLGINCCGDTLGSGYYANGYNTSIQTSRSVAYYFGGTYYFYALPIAVRMVLGEQTNDPLVTRTALGDQSYHTNKDNRSVTFDRYTFEVTPIYNFTRDVRFGFGYTRHMSPVLDASDFGGGIVKFKDANGLVIEFGSKIAKKKTDNGDDRLWLDFRFVHIRYQAQGFSGSVDGSHFGIYLSYGG